MSHVERPYEPETASALGLFLGMMAILAGLGLILAAVYGLAALLGGAAPPLDPRRATPVRHRAPQALHWEDPPGDLAAHRWRVSQRLGEYDWVDRGQGVVRIPLERAMELLADELAGTAWQAPPGEQEPDEAAAGGAER